MSRPPRPVQQRSVATIERAIDAAVQLLATDAGVRLRLSDVTALSGSATVHSSMISVRARD